MKRKRRNHSAAFKAKVALEAVKEEKTLAELVQQYGFHANQISSWKRQLPENVDEVFESGADKKEDHETEVKELRAKVGELVKAFSRAYHAVIDARQFEDATSS